MKYIVAIIQPDRLDDVLDILEKKEIHLVTVSNVMGRGRQKGISEVYRSCLLYTSRLVRSLQRRPTQPRRGKFGPGTPHRGHRDPTSPQPSGISKIFPQKTVGIGRHVCVRRNRWRHGAPKHKDVTPFGQCSPLAAMPVS